MKNPWINKLAGLIILAAKYCLRKESFNQAWEDE